MSNVVAFKPKPFIEITSGRVEKSRFRGDVGRWFHTVVFIDADGGFVDIQTPNLAYAQKCAQDLAADSGCGVLDRSEPEPSA